MSLFAQLKRRNVIRVGLTYAIIGWVLAQIAEFAFENFGAPDWVLKSVVVILLLGLPLALFFTWTFEVTPEGIKRPVQEIPEQIASVMDVVLDEEKRAASRLISKRRQTSQRNPKRVACCGHQLA